MRCPKCGYISYDHQDSCTKCKKDISKLKDVLGGGVKKITPVQYLVFGKELEDLNDLAEENQDNEIAIDEDYIDSDLEIIMDDTEEPTDDDDSSADFSFEDDEDDSEDKEIDFDFSFDDEPEETPKPLGLDIPEELNDLSDLTPTTQHDEDKEIDFDFSFDEKDEEDEEEISSLDDLSLDIDDIGDDLDSVQFELDAQASTPAPEKEISLDDIDLSIPLESSAATPPAKTDDPINMNSSLDFELNLDGLDIELDEIEIKK